MRLHRAGAITSVVIVALTSAACGEDVPRTPLNDRQSLGPSATAGPAGASAPAIDLSAVDCATEDPTGVGQLTGVWRGSEGGVYYIRQVGDCVWWFGTDVRDIQPGQTGQPGFANVAIGRIDGARVEVEWADLPMGDTLGGGGLSLLYDEERDQLAVIAQRGDWQPFGATMFSRLGPAASPQASQIGSASP